MDYVRIDIKEQGEGIWILKKLCNLQIKQIP